MRWRKAPFLMCLLTEAMPEVFVVSIMVWTERPSPIWRSGSFVPRYTLK